MGLLRPVLVLCGEGTALTCSHPPSQIPKVFPAEGCSAFLRAGYFLFDLSISRFVLSTKHFLFNALASLYVPIKNYFFNLFFLKLNVTGLFSTLFSLFVLLVYCSLACISSQLSRDIPFPTTSKSLTKL